MNLRKKQLSINLKLFGICTAILLVCASILLHYAQFRSYKDTILSIIPENTLYYEHVNVKNVSGIPPSLLLFPSDTLRLSSTAKNELAVIVLPESNCPIFITDNVMDDTMQQKLQETYFTAIVAEKYLAISCSNEQLKKMLVENNNSPFINKKDSFQKIFSNTALQVFVDTERLALAPEWLQKTLLVQIGISLTETNTVNKNEITAMSYKKINNGAEIYINQGDIKSSFLHKLQTMSLAKTPKFADIYISGTKVSSIINNLWSFLKIIQSDTTQRTQTNLDTLKRQYAIGLTQYTQIAHLLDGTSSLFIKTTNYKESTSIEDTIINNKVLILIKKDKYSNLQEISSIILQHFSPNVINSTVLLDGSTAQELLVDEKRPLVATPAVLPGSSETQQFSLLPGTPQLYLGIIKNNAFITNSPEMLTQYREWCPHDDCETHTDATLRLHKPRILFDTPYSQLIIEQIASQIHIWLQ